MALFVPLGCPHHAGAAADPRTDRHAAPGAAAEHPDPQRADSEDCRGGALTGSWRKIQKGSGRPRLSFSVIAHSSLTLKQACIVTQKICDETFF